MNDHIRIQFASLSVMISSPNSPTRAIGAVKQNILKNLDVCLAYVSGTEEEEAHN